MYRATSNFTVGTKAYFAGDTIAEGDNATVEADDHLMQFVVRVSVNEPSLFPTP
jgi:hypothetical protein